jgi:peptidoglycan/xylan/chitin deacetylase (PgdA/CDA1 family)
MFFFKGNAIEARPSDAAYVANQGMVIGNHTYDHPDLSTLSDSQVNSQLSRTQTLITNNSGQTPNVFRPPYGSYTSRTYTLGSQLGLNLVTWTHDTKDYNSPPTNNTVNFVLSNARDQAIFLMHDGFQNTLDAIPGILSGLQAKGLCSGKIVPSFTSIPNEWGDPQYVRVVPF